MDPAEFCRLGVKLISGSQIPDAASCRTAIGRAYYAALNRADEALARWGASCGKGPQKHGLAVRFLHATVDPDLNLASAALDLAKKVMDSLEDVDNDPARRTSAKGHIKTYRQKTNIP